MIVSRALRQHARLISAPEFPAHEVYSAINQKVLALETRIGAIEGKLQHLEEIVREFDLRLASLELHIRALAA